MRVDLQKNLQLDYREADSVVIRNRFGDPLVVVVEKTPGEHEIITRLDPDFDDAMWRLGLSLRPLHTEVVGGEQLLRRINEL